MTYEFPVAIYGNFQKFSDTISRARVRIFYKGLNRNRSYITEEFAEKLIQTLSYVPVKGIFEEVDYTDHGDKRSEGRIYGVVPADHNFAWEKHVDEDGVEREYACCDVLLYTAIYPEAELITGKGQSMEIYGPSIKGQWIYMEGKKVFRFEEGCFLGLQVLGDDTEPCFEGAAFFSMYQQVEDIYEKLKQCKQNFEKGGKESMDGINFKLSDGQKYDAIWNLLNAEYYNEENNWSVRYVVTNVYDDYALAYDLVEDRCYRQYYTKNDATDTVELGKKEVCYIVDVNEAEKEALDKMNAVGEGSYTKAQESYEKLVQDNETLTTTNTTLTTEKETLSGEFATLQNTYEEVNNKVVELENTISELNTKIEEYTSQMESDKNSIEALTSENESLKEFKKTTETAEKRAIVDSYSDNLDAEIIAEYTNEKLENMSKEDLEKELCFKLVKSNPTAFSKNAAPQYLPKDDGPKSGLEEILSKYKK